MTRRIGFGDEKPSPKDAAVRRGRDRSGPREAPAQPRAAPQPARSPWPEAAGGETARQMEPERRERGPSLGKLLVLSFLWAGLIGWTLSAYGGLENLIWTLRAAVDGVADPATLAPLLPPLVVGVIATRLMTRRR